MRTARLVGLSPDGRSLIVATDSGEELAIAADDRLRAALRGDRPRLGQLEIEMESSLSPREIQTRIRSGEDLEDVVRLAGIGMERVERFAAPVLAEREHIATLAMGSSVRRRGETSGHRILRVVLTERLQARGVDLDSLRWDSYRLPDGRWAVTASYASGGSSRRAEFVFDVPGRYSVAANDDARWVLGEQSPAKGPQPGRRPSVRADEEDGDGTEPTLDLNDELALVRAVQEPPKTPPSEREPLAVVRPLPEPEPDDDAEPEQVDTAEAQQVEGEGGLDILYAMLDGDAEPEQPAEPGPTDASAVPETSLTVVPDAWEPAITVNYPVEPSLEEEETGGHVVETASDEPGRPERPVAIDDRQDEADELDEETRDQPDQTPPEPEPQPAKPARRKRAAVPSWDEIMFGGPKQS